MKHIEKLLTVPGNGVYTVHTAREKKERLFDAYYKTKNIETAKTKWEKSLTKLNPKKPWVLGIPSDNGGGIQRGANWGPLALRGELLSERERYQDLGDVRVIPHLLHDKYLNEETISLCRKALYGKASLKLPVSPLSIAEKALTVLYKDYPQARILGLGGDHSTSYPLVKAWILSRKKKASCGLLHFDAHTDLLEHRLGIDLCFGTWTFQVLKDFASRDHVVQVGIRSSGKTKEHWKNNVGIEQLWAKEVNERGVEAIAAELTAHYEKLGVKELYVSFDIDALDEKYAAATGTPEKDGLLPSDCAAIIRLLAEKFTITGADLMEVAPYVWPEGVEPRDQQASLMVAGEMVRLLLDVLEP